MLSWYRFLFENGPKTTLFDLKIVKHLIKVSVFYWYLIQFWPVNYSFEGKNMNYKMVQNLSQSVGRIKKLIFLPFSIRVFGFSSRHKWLNWFWIFASSSDYDKLCCFDLFPTFGFRNHDFHSFFKFWTLFWCVNLDWTKYDIDKTNGNITSVIE